MCLIVCMCVPLKHHKRVPLEGVELEQWEQGRALEGTCVCVCIRVSLRVCLTQMGAMEGVELQQ